MCRTWTGPRRTPSRCSRLFASSRAPLLAYANTVPMPPSMSIHESSLRRAGPIRQRVELLLEVEQPLGERLEHGGALVEGAGAKRRAAHLARMVSTAAKSRPPLEEARGDHLAGRRIAQRDPLVAAGLPATAHIALQFHERDLLAARLGTPRLKTTAAPAELLEERCGRPVLRCPRLRQIDPRRRDTAASPRISA